MRREMRSGFSMKIPTRPSPILFSHGLRLAASLVEVIGFAASLVEEIKEIKEIIIPLGKALSAISAISAGHYYLMRIVFLLSRFLLSRRNKGNSRNYSYSPLRCSFCSFCGTLLSLAHSILLSRSHRLCRFARRSRRLAASLVEEIKEIMLSSLCAALSAISAISAGNKHLPRENRIVPQK